MGRKGATDAEVIDAAKKCGCHEFIMGLENGYQTVCGASGGHLSGGERQRISIARAMLKDTPIVILDEATSYTDPENEAVIQSALARLVRGKTLLVIAHRLSTIADADQIIVVNQGKIEATGTQAELLASCPLYQTMWEAHISVKDDGEVGVMLKTLKKFFAFCGVDNRRLFMASIWLGVVSAICSAMRIPSAALSFRRCCKRMSPWRHSGRALESSWFL